MAYFPLFTDLTHATALVVGGGTVAARKVAVLQDYCQQIRVVAPEIHPEIQTCSKTMCVFRPFCPADLEGIAIAILATNDRNCNRTIAQLCQQRHIPVNTVDDPELCTFIFPSLLRRGEVVAAISSGGSSPVMTQYVRDALADVLTEHVGALAAQLGALRPMVKAATETEGQRKVIYRTLLQQGLETGTLPTQEDARSVIEKVLNGTDCAHL